MRQGFGNGIIDVITVGSWNSGQETRDHVYIIVRTVMILVFVYGRALSVSTMPH